MNDQELMSFAIARSNDSIIKNPILRDAMNKDLGPRNMYSQGQLVQPNADGSRPGYSGKMKWTAKEVQEIYKDLPENVTVSKRTLPSGKTDYTYRAKIRYKNKLYTFPSKVATLENKKQLIKDVEAKWDKLAPNRISREEYAKLRLLPENRRLKGEEFAEKLNKKYKKVTYRGEKWNNQNVFNYDLETPRGTKRIADDLGFFEKRTVAEAKDIIKQFSGGKDFLKNKNLTDVDITTRASEYVAQEKFLSKEGGKSWPRGRQNKRKIWSNIYESHKQGGRFELVNGKDLADADGTINWKKGSTYDNKKNPFEPSNANWRNAKFKDKKSGKIFTYDNLIEMVDKHGGGYNKAIKAYEANAAMNQQTFNGKTLNDIIRESMIKKEYEVLTGQKVKMNDPDFLKYMGKRKPTYSFTEAHHFKGIKDYPFDTEPAFRSANRKQGILQNTYNKAVKSGDPKRIAKAKEVYINEMNTLSDDYGGIKYKMDDKKFVGTSGTTESIVKRGLEETNLSNKNKAKLLRKMGFECEFAGNKGGAARCDDPASYIDDIKKTKADARSSDVLKRAKALTKERKALSVAKTLPKVGNIIRKGVQVGAGAVSGLLSAVGLGPVGFAIEAAIEGGFYDNARRNGYTHEQAYAETFLPKLITDAAGTTNTDTRLFEGADAMIEKEKLGKEDSLASKFNNAQNIFDQEVNALNNMVSSYMQMQNSGVQKEDLDAFLEKIYLQEDKVKNLIKTLKPGTPEYEAYKTAEENQTGRMENRKNDYLSMNRIPYVDENFEIQEKTFPLSPAQIKMQEQKLESKIKSGDKRRDKEMEEYKKGYNDSVLEPFFIKENERVNWDEVYGDGPDQETLKWKDIFEGDGAYDLTDKISIAGGVANMAQGGIMNIRKK